MSSKSNYIHQGLADGKWFTFSLADQMGNIGSEVDRYVKWSKVNDEEQSSKAFDRALELMDLTMQDPKHRMNRRSKEIGRLREVFCDSVYGGSEYNTPLKYFQDYFLDFAIVARTRAGK